MRTISPTLRDAQESASATPYIKLLFTSKDGGTTYDHSARILQLEHHEEAYRDWADIILRNDDLAIEDLTGYWTQVGYGFTTGFNTAEPNGDNAGNEYSYTPRLWVKSQMEVSAEGQLQVILHLEGMWAVMAENFVRIGTPPFYDDTPYTTSTIYAIVDALLTEISTAEYTFALDALGTQDDGIINTYTPYFEFNEGPRYDNVLDLVEVLMAMTKCYLRPESGLEFKVVYPQTTDSVDRTYYSWQTHYFYEYTESINLLIPNHIYIYYDEANDWAETAGEAEDTIHQDRYMEVIALYRAGEITNLTDANNRAAAILAKAKAEILSGRLIVPHDCGLELYDRVVVLDSRGA